MEIDLEILNFSRKTRNSMMDSDINRDSTLCSASNMPWFQAVCVNTHIYFQIEEVLLIKKKFHRFLFFSYEIVKIILTCPVEWRILNKFLTLLKRKDAYCFPKESVKIQKLPVSSSTIKRILWIPLNTRLLISKKPTNAGKQYGKASINLH